jgi:hypothetical protein
VSDTLLHLRRSQTRNFASKSKAVPGFAVWLGDTAGAELAHEQFERASQEMGMSCLSFELRGDGESCDLDDEIIEQCVTASLLIAPLHGTYFDDLVHFVCGAIMAYPRVAIQDKAIARAVRLVSDPRLASSLAADSALKCHEVRSISGDDVMAETRRFGSAYREVAGLNVDRR